MIPSRRVCVIGAGISGLVTGRVLLDDGFDVVLFEKEAELGGVWAASRTYPGLHANNPRETYAFSDHPYPRTAGDFPSAPEIRDYLHSYAERFGVLPRIRFATEVVHVAPVDTLGGPWRVTVQTATGSRETIPFDYVVVCNGVFSEPAIPAVAGAERFTGRVVHSSQATPPGLIAGSRVVVVGSGKSALDCASWAARDARACTLVFRRPYWMVPRYLFGRIRIDRLLLSRFTEAFFGYHRLGGIEALLHRVGRPLVWLWWTMQSHILRRLLGMTTPLVPDARLPVGYENVGVVSDFYPLVRAGAIQPRRGSIRRFAGGRTIELDTGESLDADVVIFATGWRQTLACLDDDVRRRVERDGGFDLYRLILPPDVPRLGFVGYNSSTACQLTSEIAAHWLSQHFRGELSLPSPEEMRAEIARFRRWAADVMPARGGGYFIGPHVTHYLDDLLRDMGLAATRTSNFVTENLVPWWPSRYATIGEERRRLRGGSTPAHRVYLGGGPVFALLALIVLGVVLWR
jgi:cation diffusion facilitator CzcD-associated flavoprotein CzcO